MTELVAMHDTLGKIEFQLKFSLLFDVFTIIRTRIVHHCTQLVTSTHAILTRYKTSNIFLLLVNNVNSINEEVYSALRNKISPICTVSEKGRKRESSHLSD